MNRSLLFVLMLAFLISFAFADTPRPMEAVQEAIVPHSDGGATGFCSVAYYDYCSGWIWQFDIGYVGEAYGVVFDLPPDCGKLPDESCVNTHFWWYWRNTYAGWGAPVSYRLYEVDDQNCLTDCVGEIDWLYPVERWNYVAGLGTVTTDRAALVGYTPVDAWGGGPNIATDNNVMNMQVGCAPVPIVPRSFHFGNQEGTIYCPPVPLEDPLGYVNLIMDAGFDCQDPTSTDPASWGGVKELFR